MGCNSGKETPAAPKAAKDTLMAPPGAEDKQMADYAKMLVSSNADDVKATLAGLSEESRTKLTEALSKIEPAKVKSLSEYVVDAKASNPSDLNSAVSGLDAQNRKKLEDAIASLEPKTDAPHVVVEPPKDEDKKDVPETFKLPEGEDQPSKEEPVIETEATNNSWCC